MGRRGASVYDSARAQRGDEKFRRPDMSVCAARALYVGLHAAVSAA
jgi:hypothetical protein